MLIDSSISAVDRGRRAAGSGSSRPVRRRPGGFRSRARSRDATERRKCSRMSFRFWRLAKTVGSAANKSPAAGILTAICSNQMNFLTYFI